MITINAYTVFTSWSCSSWFKQVANVVPYDSQYAFATSMCSLIGLNPKQTLRYVPGRSECTSINIKIVLNVALGGSIYSFNCINSFLSYFSWASEQKSNTCLYTSEYTIVRFRFGPALPPMWREDIANATGLINVPNRPTKTLVHYR